MDGNEIIKLQGTRKSDVAPWMSYAAGMDEKLDPQLKKEMDEYALKFHVKSSTQNEEELCRQKELSNTSAREFQFLHPDEYKNEGPRIGRRMHSSEFIRTLREHGVKCWYRQHPHKDKVTLMLQRRGFEMIKPEIGCWVQLGFMPEYSIVRFDDHGIPLNEKYRGWRTCLLQLILKEVITEKTACKVFGIPTGEVATRYLSTLYGMRNYYIKAK